MVVDSREGKESPMQGTLQVFRFTKVSFSNHKQDYQSSLSHHIVYRRVTTRSCRIAVGIPIAKLEGILATFIVPQFPSTHRHVKAGTEVPDPDGVHVPAVPIRSVFVDR